MKVVVGGHPFRAMARRLIGQGGEAEVYAMNDKQVVKLFKRPEHPDFAASKALRAAAEKRLEVHQKKLLAFPSPLPSAVIAPTHMARTPSGEIAGYAMRRIYGDPLYALSSARSRARFGFRHRVHLLEKLYNAVRGVHLGGVVIGDFNDLNVIVSGNDAFLIDVDSFQYGGFRCSVFSERFLDPRLADSGQVELDYSTSTDWFAFAVIAVQTLLCVGPYGGVHLPEGSAPRVPAARRAAERLSIFNAKVRLPRPALEPEALPDRLRAYFKDVFAGDHRDPMPIRWLGELTFAKCSSCGADHARRQCPRCAPKAALVTKQPIRGAVRIADAARCKALDGRLRPRRDFWIRDRRLVRKGPHGEETVGEIMAGKTRFWTGERFGFGFYGGGRLRFGFVFDVGRRGINDQVALDPQIGTLAEANCALSTTRAWFSTVEARGPHLVSHLTVIDHLGNVVASQETTAETWTSGLAGACAVGDVLLVPTDRGVVRLESRGTRIAVAKTFALTDSVVDSAAELATDGRSLYAKSRGEWFELSL